jgi:hypothetical protein
MSKFQLFALIVLAMLTSYTLIRIDLWIEYRVWLDNVRWNISHPGFQDGKNTGL